MAHPRHAHPHYLVTREDLDRIDGLLESINRFVVALIESRQFTFEPDDSAACDEFEAHIEATLEKIITPRQMAFPWAEQESMDF